MKRPAPELAETLHLGIPRRPGRAMLAALRHLLGRPRATGEILLARLQGRRLRARQKLAALVGIDHRLALPAGILDRFPPAPAPPRDAIRVFGDGVLVPGAAARIAAAFAADPELQAVYGDALIQDRARGPVRPLLPPVFDADLLAAVDYLEPCWPAVREPWRRRRSRAGPPTPRSRSPSGTAPARSATCPRSSRSGAATRPTPCRRQGRGGGTAIATPCAATSTGRARPRAASSSMSTASCRSSTFCPIRDPW